MTNKEKKTIEELANIEHKRWAGWQDYFFSRCHIKNDIGYDDRYVYFALPRDLHDRWIRQIKTSYWDLSEEEKESDRKEVMKYLPLLEEKLKEKY